jgi:endonuclease/exonuclease/phosphatase family metal-dependent hydrolase
LWQHTNRTRSYPGVLPFLHLDHIYFDPELRLQRFTLHRSRRSLIASDHLPLIADFMLRHRLAEDTNVEDFPVAS